MRIMRKLFLTLVIFLVGLLGLTFALQKSEPVLVNYYLGLSWHGSLALLLFFTLTAGLLIGWIAGRLRGLILQRRQVRALRRDFDGQMNTMVGEELQSGSDRSELKLTGA